MESRKIYERCYLIQKPLSFGQINRYFLKPVANAISNKALSNKTFRFSNMPQFEKCLGNFYFYSKEKKKSIRCIHKYQHNMLVKQL